MRKIDAFAHILPRRYLDRLERHLADTMPAAQLRYYREGVFTYDPALTDLDARWRVMDRFGDYSQVLVLAVPPIEEIGPPDVAADFARLANDEMAELVHADPDRFVGFAAALPLQAGEAPARPLFASLMWRSARWERPARRLIRTCLERRWTIHGSSPCWRRSKAWAGPCGCIPPGRPNPTSASGGRSAGRTKRRPRSPGWS